MLLSGLWFALESAVVRISTTVNPALRAITVYALLLDVKLYTIVEGPCVSTSTNIYIIKRAQLMSPPLFPSTTFARRRKCFRKATASEEGMHYYGNRWHRGRSEAAKLGQNDPSLERRLPYHPHPTSGLLWHRTFQFIRTVATVRKGRFFDVLKNFYVTSRASIKLSK